MMVTLITGGSGSGKSSYAEQEIMKLGNRRRIYIATMKLWDDECRSRIGRHRAMREGKQFETVECYRGLGHLVLPSGEMKTAVLLECLSNLVSNELFGTSGEDFPKRISVEYGFAVADLVVNGVMSLTGKAADVVIVTNEVFSDGDYRRSFAAVYGAGAGKIPCGDDFSDWKDSTALYLKVLGEANCRLAAAADRVIEVAAGIPVVLKDNIRCGGGPKIHSER